MSCYECGAEKSDVGHMQVSKAFAKAWVRGCRMIGPEKMGIKLDNQIDCPDKWDMCPDVALIEKKFDRYSTSEQVLIAAMVGFFDTYAGHSLMERAGRCGMASIAGRLDRAGKEVVSDLIRNYQGW